jgi:exopolysaccharide production repressor protein
MTLPKFLIGMMAVILVVAIWSYFDSASAAVIAMRVVACALILQVGYFLIVLVMVLASPKPTPQQKVEAEPNPTVRKQADSLTSPRSSG